MARFFEFVRGWVVTVTEHTASYAYDPVMGALTGLTDRRGNAFGFRYDLLGRTRHITMPGQVTDTMKYDLEGRLVWRYEAGASTGVLHSETMQYDARGKLMLATHPGVSEHRNWYSGSGMLVANDWAEVNSTIVHRAEETGTDALGNAYRRRSSDPEMSEDDYPVYDTRYAPGSSRVRSVTKREPEELTVGFIEDVTEYWYDIAGNGIRTFQEIGADIETGYTVGREVETRSYYGADGKLRAYQKYDVRRNDGGWKMAGVWEEYRYDPLGRRIMVRTRGDGGMCNVGEWECTSSITRFVWAGDQLLWELKDAEGTNAAAAGGVVSYTHGGGIDRPLVITKGSNSIIPHQNWRGQFSRGTWGVNSAGAVGTTSECANSASTGCVWIAWPARYTNVRHAITTESDIRNWWGGLVDGMRDASGQMYMRNRYYDPASGQFTQPDPIGLAGGLNAYGFANGDPVSYADPYGLKADSVYVGSRPLDDPELGKRYNHSAIRVDQTVIELLQDENGRVDFSVYNMNDPDDQAYLSRYTWTPVDVPSGQTEEEFDVGVLRSAGRQIRRMQGDVYTPFGNGNCHTFTYRTVIGAGGRIPASAAGVGGRQSPGLCGGIFKAGGNCQESPR